MTNGDHIRKITDLELAVILDWLKQESQKSEDTE